MTDTMNHTNIVCNNCGIKGHSYRDCRKPVLSYGHILYRTDTQEPQILMVQRKDSLCYIEFIRGKYDVYNKSYIQLLINKFNREERKRVMEDDYETLWRKLWGISTEPEEHSYKSDFYKGRDKFHKLVSGSTIQHSGQTSSQYSLRSLLENATEPYSGSEWEFPKGRRNVGETNRECAIREFQEETNYTTNDYELIDNIAPLDEEYMGENHIRYKHVYYMGMLRNYRPVPGLSESNLDQINEIKDIQWLTEKEAMHKIRDYQNTRKQVVSRVFEIVNNFNCKYFVVE